VAFLVVDATQDVFRWNKLGPIRAANMRTLGYMPDDRAEAQAHRKCCFALCGRALFYGRQRKGLSDVYSLLSPLSLSLSLCLSFSHCVCLSGTLAANKMNCKSCGLISIKFSESIDETIRLDSEHPTNADRPQGRLILDPRKII